ncbi:hypothetical protein QR680_002208 [Steinernema hermaphroditum]|uniref:Ubiquitin carboxyl-terminal hydrolase 7 n=1 Tax=Steinernema hermaphroditum TaxID=289476 RepID=A0AA39H1U4_9BILA|nr:hypothetical protein QR680_002208 [Steinernema hermaphroditum]
MGEDKLLQGDSPMTQNENNGGGAGGDAVEAVEANEGSDMPTLERHGLNDSSEQDGIVPMDHENEDGVEQMEVSNDENSNHGGDTSVDDMESEDSDKYKPEGTLSLDIENFTDFMKGSPEGSQRLSNQVYVRGLPWRILAIPREFRPNMHDTKRSARALGFFLQCNGDSEVPTWTCQASATLKVVALDKRSGQEDHSRRITHTFYPKENDWGYSQFMTCETLLNPENGYVVNDIVRLEVHVCADAPHGVAWDSKKLAGFIGLKNQGATCYMNSILQTLFFCNKLRKAVYEMPTEDDDCDSSVALAMQRVFYELQHSDKPVGTKKLTKSFGWDSVDSFLQHDVQELCRVLLDNLESKMKNTKVADTIPTLFKGRMKSYIRCTEVSFESSREEFFYDVQLNVKGKKDIYASFRDYTASEVLDGDNKYDAGELGMQRAEKGVKFTSFPPVLHLQLMRFQYDPAVDNNVKINDRFEFCVDLDLNQFVVDNETDDYNYVLQAVLVHSGDFHGGHYVVFINTNLKGTPRWCKFDDDVVSRAAEDDAVLHNFGGDDVELGRAFTNAYMLVYVKKDAFEEVLSDVNDSDIPDHLKRRFDQEKRVEIQRKKDRLEAHLFTDLVLITEDDMLDYHGFDLYDNQRLNECPLHKVRVQKQMSIPELYEFVAERLDLKLCEFRLWAFQESAPRIPEAAFVLERLRPHTLLKRDQYGPEPIQTVEMLVESDRNILFIEVAPFERKNRGLGLEPYDEHSDVLFFVKEYEPEKRSTRYLGSIFLNFEKSLEEFAPEISKLAGYPAITKYNYYEELSPQFVGALKEAHRKLSEDATFLEVSDGGIIIVERADKATAENNARSNFLMCYNRIFVEAHVNPDLLPSTASTAQQPIEGEIGIDWRMPQVCEWIASKTCHDPANILLWTTSQFCDKPTSYLSRDRYEDMLARDFLGLFGNQTHDPRVQRRYKIYYNKIPVPFTEMENRRQLRVQLMDDKMHISEATLFPEKTGTVRSILDEAEKIFPFSENGTRKLRLVFTGTTPATLRVLLIFPFDTPVVDVAQKLSANHMLRVEETPADQVDVGTDQLLLSVSHFDKETNRMFGVPFYLKVTNHEPLDNVRRRVKEILDVPEREFEKYKFALVISQRVVKYLDMDSTNVVNLSDLHFAGTTGTAAPYLGIDHLNKQRTTRGSLPTEKPIIIHN